MNKTIEEQAQDTIDQMLQQYIGNALVNVHTQCPAIIESFDSEKQTAQVQPAIKRIFIGDVEVPLPKLINVPIMFPRGGGFAITFPIKEGDEILLAFCERALDTWYQSGGVQKPLDRRMHDLTDGVGVLGLYNQTNVLSAFATDGLVLRNESDNTKITIRDGEIHVVAPKMIVDVPDTVWTGDIQHFGNVEQTGNFDHIGDVLRIGDTNQTGSFTLIGLMTITVNAIIGIINFLTHKHVSAAPGIDTSPPKN